MYLCAEVLVDVCQEESLNDKKILTVFISIFLIVSSTNVVFAEDTATITIDLNGGLVSPNGVPVGWTDIGDGKYSKEYPLNESVNLTEEWSNYKPIKTDHEFDRWTNDDWSYWDGFSITEDIIVKATYKAYLHVIMDLKSGTVPDSSVPSGWEKVSGHDDQYIKVFLEGTYYWDVESDWENVIPQYSDASGIGFVEWDDPEWFDLSIDNSVIEAKTDVLLNVVLDLKGGTFNVGNVPAGWVKDSVQDDLYIKQYVKGTSRYDILNELQGIVPQYSEVSGVGFVDWKYPEWYNLESDNSIIEAEIGVLKTVTVDFDGGTVLSFPSSWTQDPIETDKYTKKYPLGYSLSTINDEILNAFSIEFFDGNKFFKKLLDYSGWNVSENDVDNVLTALYVDAINLTINVPINGSLIVDGEQQANPVSLVVPNNVTASCNNGVLSIYCYSPSIEHKIESYGESGYEFDYFTLNETQFVSSTSTLSTGDIFSAVMKTGSQKYPVWIDGEQLSENNASLMDGAISYNSSTRVLTLDGANIAFSSLSGISFATNITINVVSDSCITALTSDATKCAIAGKNPENGIGLYENTSSLANLNIVGNGKLTINLKKTDAADAWNGVCAEGILANKITISTDVEIISDAVSNAAMNSAAFFGINAGMSNGITINNGKSLIIRVKSVSDGMGMPKCNLISGPLTVDGNANVELSVGSFSSEAVFSNGATLLSGTISISSNPVGKINLTQAASLNTIDGATAGAQTTDTSFIQANSSTPLILSTRGLVLVEGLNMTKDEYNSNETIEYNGTLTAKKKSDSTNVTSQIDSWDYTYYKESESGSGIWNKLSTIPTDGGSYKLVVEAVDSEYFGKLELPFTVVHVHNFSYTVNSENAAQLIATCSGINCEYNGIPLTLTLISPSSDNLVYNETVKEINFSDEEKNNWETITENNVPHIVYYLDDGVTKTNSTNSGASGEGLAPKNVGIYKAKVTIDTDKTAVIEFIITPKEYQIITGENSEWRKGSADGLIITSSAPYDEFVCVKVDGSQIDIANYTVEEGSTIVTLNKNYLETLSIGEHTFEIISNNGSISTTINIANNVANNDSPSHYIIPNTGLY